MTNELPFILNCKSEFPDPLISLSVLQSTFPPVHPLLSAVLLQDSTPFHWFLYPASPLLYPNPPYLLQFNFLPPVYSTSSPSTRQGSTPSLTLLQSLCCPPPPPPTTLIIVNYSYDVVTGELFIQLGNYII